MTHNLSHSEIRGGNKGVTGTAGLSMPMPERASPRSTSLFHNDFPTDLVSSTPRFTRVFRANQSHNQTHPTHLRREGVRRG